MEHNPAAKLIIENIQMLEHAAHLLESVIHKKIFNTIDQVIKDSVLEFNDDMIGIYDHYENETWFLSSSWKFEPFNIENNKTHNNIYAFYMLETDNLKNEKPSWWISHLFSNSYDQAVFSFCIYKNGFLKISKSELKQFCIQQNDEYPILQQIGFRFDPNINRWYLPISFLDQKTVSKHYENDTLEDALAPFNEALNILKQAHSTFNLIVQAAKKQFQIE